MAVTSGSVQTNAQKNTYFKVSWEKVSASGTTTTIRWKCDLIISAHDDAWYSNAIKILSITVNGTTVASNKTYSNISGNGTHNLIGWTNANISHSSATSEKTFTITVQGWLYNYGNSNNASGSFTLPKIVTATAPGQVTSLKISKTTMRTDDSATLSWTAPSNGGATITKYQVDRRRYTNGAWGSWAAYNSNVTSTSLTVNVSGFATTDSVQFRCRAANSQGWGSYSSAVQAACTGAVKIKDTSGTIRTVTAMRVKDTSGTIHNISQVKVKDTSGNLHTIVLY